MAKSSISDSPVVHVYESPNREKRETRDAAALDSARNFIYFFAAINDVDRAATNLVVRHLGINDVVYDAKGEKSIAAIMYTHIHIIHTSHSQRDAELSMRRHTQDRFAILASFTSAEKQLCKYCTGEK